MKKEIPALTGLRGLAALWVLMFHVTLAENSPAWGFLAGAGYLGVDLFFVLSGFVIAYNYGHVALHRSVLSYGRFLWKRFARLYPIHLAMLIAFAVAVQISPTFLPPHKTPIEEWLRALTLSNAWTTNLTFPWNTPSWSVSAEWGAYLLFPLIMVLVRRIRGLTVSWLIIALLYGLLAWELQELSAVCLEVTASRVLIGFTAGCLLFQLFEAGHKAPPAAATIVLLIFGANTYELYNEYLAATWLFAPLCPVIIIGLATRQGLAEQILGTGPAQYLGRISYSLYLCHWFVMLLLKNAPFAMALTIAGSIMLAHVLYNYVEEPARRWLTNLSSTRDPKPVDLKLA